MKTASIEKVLEIIPHQNADKLELVKVLGYTCIVQKGSFSVGDKCVFIQPDTVLPDEPWAEIFKKKSSRVKAIKLRNVWSFGIILNPDVFGEKLKEVSIGEDVSNLIKVIKYEAPVPQQLDALGPLPFHLSKTDEERYQNILDLPFGETVDVTQKIDGSSLTVYVKHTDQGIRSGICSRSLELKPECLNKYTTVVKKFNLLDKLKNFCLKNNVSLALRGEMYGIGIQSSNNNPHAKCNLGFAAFSVFNMDTLRYEEKGSKFYYKNVCDELDIEQVKTIENDVILTQDLIKKYSEEVNEIDSKPYEGIVIKYQNGSFKVINLSYDAHK